MEGERGRGCVEGEGKREGEKGGKVSGRRRVNNFCLSFSLPPFLPLSLQL